MSLLLCWTFLTSMVPASGPATEPAAKPAQPTINRDDLKAFEVVLSKVAPKTKVEVSSICSAIILTGTADSQENLTQILGMAHAVFPSCTIVNGMRLDSPQAVQLDVVLASVDRGEIRKLAHQLNLSASPGENNGEHVFFCIQDTERVRKTLVTLRKQKSVEVAASPSVTTLSGRPAYIVDGGEQAIVQTAADGSSTVTYKNFGTVVNILPIVMSNGKIHLEVQPETSYPEEGGNIRTVSSARVAVQMENGQTLVVGGLKALPAARVVDPIENGGTVAISGLKRKEKELLILVTPHRSE